MTPIPLVALLLASWAAAAAPKKAAPTPEAASEKVQRAFWAVVEASESPEFLILAEPAGLMKLPREPLLEFSAQAKGVDYDCEAMKVLPGRTPAAAVFCGPMGARVPVVVMGAAMEGFQEALVAGITGHELVHLLLRHAEKKEAFHKKNRGRWTMEFLQWKNGTFWISLERERILKDNPDADQATREALFNANLLKHFRESTPEITLFEREQEMQADFLGTHLAKLAGYDEKALGKYFAVLAESGVWETSHSGHYDPDLRAKELSWLQDQPGYDLRLMSASTPAIKNPK